MESKTLIIIYLVYSYVSTIIPTVRILLVNSELIKQHKSKIDIAEKIMQPFLEKQGMTMKLSEAIAAIKILIVIAVLFAPALIPLRALIMCVGDLSVIFNHKKTKEEAAQSMIDSKEASEGLKNVNFDEFK